MSPNLIYDYDNNKVIVDGVVFDEPEYEADFPELLRKIEEMLTKRKETRNKVEEKKKKDGEDGGE